MGGILTPKNTKTTSSTSLPSYITDAYKQSLGQASTASSQPFNYTGELAAGASPLQQAAYAGLPGAVNTAQPYIDQATGLTSAAVNPASLQQWSPEQIAKYSDPYTQSVIKATQDQFNLGNAQQQSNLVGNAASNHALGGDRVAVAQAQLAGQQQAAQAPIIAGLNSQNFAQATNEFNTQQQTDIANQQANAYKQLYGAGELGNLGQLAQGTQLTGLGAELNAGTQQQATQQNADTLQYQNYLTQLGYPLAQAQSLAQIATSFAPSQETTTKTQPGSSLLGSIAGLGLSAAGLGMFGPVGGLLGGVLGGSSGQSTGAANNYNKRGGAIGSRAEGGEFDDSEDDSDSDDLLGTGEDALAQFASPPAGLGAAPVETIQSNGTAPPSQPSQSAGQPPGGLSPVNEGLLAAGLGTLASQGRPLEMVGQGGLKGLSTYDAALKRDQQEKALEAQNEYRTSMSQTASKRAEALAHHYENADTKPVLIKGKTFQWYYPSDGSYHDTHIDNPDFTSATARNDIAGKNATTNARRADIEAKRLENLIATGGGSNGGVFGFKYKAAKANGMSDSDALQFAGGHREMSAADARKYAMGQATASANANKDSFDNIDAYNKFRDDAYQSNLTTLMSGISDPNGGGGTPAPTEGTAAPPPKAIALLKEGVEQHFANGQVWTLKGGKPVRVK